jgi:hypothetical protein
VSDPHVVRSDADTPTLNDAEYDASPRLAPCTVTLDAPVPARLLLLCALIASASDENACVALPALLPNVRISCLLPDWLVLVRHLTVESDSQVDLSQADEATFEADVYVARPIPCPRSVMLADPVAALFVTSAKLKDAS